MERIIHENYCGDTDGCDKLTSIFNEEYAKCTPSWGNNGIDGPNKSSWAQRALKFPKSDIYLTYRVSGSDSDLETTVISKADLEYCTGDNPEDVELIRRVLVQNLGMKLIKAD